MGKYKAANIVFPIPLEREFQYLIPPALNLKEGMRVAVDFRGRKKVGIVVGLDREARIKKIKPVLYPLDGQPALSRENLKFAKALTRIYPYPQGEFLFMLLPAYLKKTRKFSLRRSPVLAKAVDERKKVSQAKPVFIKGSTFRERYEVWRKELKNKLREGSALVCFPQISYLEEARLIIEKDFGKVNLVHSGLREKELFTTWKDARRSSLILGTRMAIFHYPCDLRLIVVEEENSPFYFQEEKPFYHLRDLAFILSKLKSIDLILSGDYPTLNCYKLIEEKKMSLKDQGERAPRIKILNAAQNKRKIAVTPLLGELLRKNIAERKRSVVIYNRRSFAQVLKCPSCGYTLRCPLCSGLLKLSFKEGSSPEGQGVCHYCGMGKAVPKICPECKGGYISSFGLGIERIETNLKRIFPEVKIDSWEKRRSDSQIILSTSQIISYLYREERFDAGFVLDPDFLLSRLDYDATFNTFLYLKKLSPFFKDALYLFTRNAGHYLFKHIQGDWNNFYEEEVSLRRKLKLPPYGLIAKITLRSSKQNNLFNRSESLYNSLKDKNLEIYGPFKGYPFKLRGKYRYSLIVKSRQGLLLRKVLKSEAEALRRSHLQLAIEIR